MHHETELLVAAIESLKQEPNFFKDYVFPIASAFFTSILGATIAYFTLKYQESIQIEKDKMNSANKWILLADSARSTLLSIKSNYYKKLTDSPIQRSLVIPDILFYADRISENFQDLSFIVPIADATTTDYPKWSQIPRIYSMFSNYNYLLKLWEQRNEINQPFQEELLKQYPNQGYAHISNEKVISSVDHVKLVRLIDLTERVIKITDDILLELDDFLSEFPNYTKQLINVKRLKKYGSILLYSNNDNQELLSLLKRVPEVDFSSVESLYGQSADEIKEQHKTGYEQ